MHPPPPPRIWQKCPLHRTPQNAENVPKWEPKLPEIQAIVLITNLEGLAHEGEVPKMGDKLPKIPQSEKSTKMRPATAENHGICASNSRQIPIKIV